MPFSHTQHLEKSWLSIWSHHKIDCALGNNITSGLLQRSLYQHTRKAARLITRAYRYDHITKTLIYIHWLPIKERIKFKVLVTTFKALHNLAPTYISELLKQHVPPRSLRSSSKCLLHEPPFNLQTAGYRSFGVAAPRIWNQIPDRIRSMDNLTTFKRTQNSFVEMCICWSLMSF